ncbi:hypothetical protein CDD83_5868 [Cordyceps sp. RAO-2017]|nr:hypothetical protein CDD83_5868 [Cordyceps sp. RAO-2017]
MAYSAIKHIPGLGTVYSIERTALAGRTHNSKRFWSSFADTVECIARDVLLFSEAAEPVLVTILHPMVESVTQKSIEIFHEEPRTLPQIHADVNLDAMKDYVLVSEKVEGEHEEKIFGSHSKGFFHFYNSTFTGTIQHPVHAPNGEKIQLNMPVGLYDGARIYLTWRWSVNAYTRERKAEATLGVVKLYEGPPTTFGFTRRVGAGDWEGYDFTGTIISKDKIQLETEIRGTQVFIDMTRVSEN